MKIHGFIFNWKGHESRAAALEAKIGSLINVSLINSEEQLEDKYPRWIHLDDTAYFSAQWNKAVQLFDADIFFHIQADADFDHFDLLFARAKSLFERYKLGVYEPNVNFTFFEYDRSKLRSVDAELYEVPVTDCTCWFIEGRILRMLPLVDLAINRYGWGITRAVAALCRLNGMLCVRDYSFTIRHPKGRSYPSAEAMQQMEAYVRSLSPEIQLDIFRMQRRLNQVRAMA